MLKLNCPFCFPEVEYTLGNLSKEHIDYYLVALLNDGTKKWYYCDSCNGAYCYDKISSQWQISPNTYIDFVNKGIIKDILNE